MSVVILFAIDFVGVSSPSFDGGNLALYFTCPTRTKYNFLVLNIAINDLSGVFPSVLYPRRSISSHSHLAYVKKRPALAAARRAAVSILNEDRSESR